MVLMIIFCIKKTLWIFQLTLHVKNGNVRYTMIPLKPLSDKKCGEHCLFSEVTFAEKPEIKMNNNGYLIYIWSDKALKVPLQIWHYRLCKLQEGFYKYICFYIQLGTIYRVSHETWQLVNSFECLLSYTVLIYKDFLQFILFKKKNSFTQIYFNLKSFLQ